MTNKTCFILLLLLPAFLSFFLSSVDGQPNGNLREEIEKLENEIAEEHKREREAQREANAETENRKRDEAMAMEGVAEETFLIGPFTKSVTGKPKVCERETSLNETKQKTKNKKQNKNKNQNILFFLF